MEEKGIDELQEILSIL